MEADIRLLEDRARRIVERLRAVSGERERLEGEVRDLEKKLKDAHKARSSAAGSTGSGKLPAAVAESLREAIRELRDA